MAIPPWYIFRKLQNVSVSSEQQEELVRQRVLLLAGKSPTRTFKQEIYESEEEFFERGNHELLGHVLLRIAAAGDMKVSAWLVESEGDLFGERFSSSIEEDKMEILEDLYTEDTFMRMKDLSDILNEDIPEAFEFAVSRVRKGPTRVGDRLVLRDRSGLNTPMALRYTEAPELLRARKLILYKGWLLGRMSDFLPTIKRRFEQRLNTRIDEISERLENDTQLQNRVSYLLKLLEDNETRPLIVSRNDNFAVENISLEGSAEENFFLLPPCLQDLITKVNKTGYLSHWQRFQLGIFLKTTGMPVDEQLRYWYSKAVDNIGLSFEEFSKRAGYIIRHIYGLEGGKIDYTMPACKTIQDKMHCTFKHNAIDTVAGNLAALLERVEEGGKKTKYLTERIILHTQAFEAGRACANYLKLITGDMSDKPTSINHPLTYIKITSERGTVVGNKPEEPEVAE